MARHRDTEGAMLLLLAPAVAGCPLPRSEAELASSLDSAEQAWGVDPVAFAESVALARVILPCLAVPIPPTTAARVHRAEGLAAFFAKDYVSAGTAFAAARAIEPEWHFPEWMVPPDNPLRTLYDTRTPTPSTVSAPPPKRSWRLYFDGLPGRVRPAGQPTVVQLFGPDQAQTTAWLTPDAPLPTYPLRGAGLRAPLLVTAGIATVGAAGLIVANQVALETVYPRSTPETEEANIALVNGLGAGGLVLGAVAAGTGAGAFLFASW